MKKALIGFLTLFCTMTLVAKDNAFEKLVMEISPCPQPPLTEIFGPVLKECDGDGGCPNCG